ncbi:T9SS type A sorting domain-containing protein [Chryseobacterium sp. MYb328]|uniref:T9SS type A sorting domain-containing protein n=1 Tax=Chryseobacterium sp. MYb328 TaxID=2745231 RepID=UPI0030986D59
MKTHLFSAILFAYLLSGFSFVNGQTYCNPTYTSGCGDWKVTKVTIPQANFNDSSFTGDCNTLRNKTSTIINMNPNTTYGINVSTTGWVSCGMAIDFNQNGNFDDAGEVLFLPDYIAIPQPTYSDTFSIPSLSPGNYRMRIWNRLANSGDGNPAQSPCGTYGFGNWVDYTVTITQTLSTKEISLSETKIYPNPVSDILTIEDTQTIQSVEIYDFNGKLIKNDFLLNKKNVSIKLSNLIPGTYTAKIKNTKGSQVFKFIKK